LGPDGRTPDCDVVAVRIFEAGFDLDIANVGATDAQHGSHWLLVERADLKLHGDGAPFKPTLTERLQQQR